MINFIRQFKDLFKNPEDKEEEEIKIDEKKRLDTLHKQARKPFKKTKLTIEDFDKASRQTEKQKNKTLSSNF